MHKILPHFECSRGDHRRLCLYLAQSEGHLVSASDRGGVPLVLTTLHSGRSLTWRNTPHLKHANGSPGSPFISVVESEPRRLYFFK